MKTSWILPATLFAMSFAQADDGLDPAYFALETQPKQMQMPKAPKPFGPQYDNRFGFTAARLVYEQTKNDATYFAVDAWGCGCFNNSRGRSFFSIAEAEARVGYNLFYECPRGCDHLTPLVGAGFMYNNVGAFKRAQFAYATAGFLYSHEFNTVFVWGFNLKGLAGQQVSSKYARRFAWGVDLAMPFIFRFTRNRHWDISLEPFYIYMESNHRNQGALGGRSTFGYRF